MVDPAAIGTDVQFAGALAELRAVRGCSIRGLARVTGIPPATLGGYFSGRHLPPATQPLIVTELLAGLGVTDPVEVAAWRDALHRVRRGSARSVSRGSGPCPYRGLEPFTDCDEALFFGRERVVAELVGDVVRLADSVTAPRMLVLVGASGSGKSSTLRAGLVAAMRHRQSWEVSVMVPGADPLASLSAARGLLVGAEQGLLVVDQAEELFSPLVGAPTRRDFLAQLLELADPRAGGSVVVIALRADFYGQAAADPGLLPVLRTSQVLLGAMDLDDLRRAVTQPAAQVGVEVDPELVDLLVRDLHPRGTGHDNPSYDAGALPLVSHALLAAWTRHRGQHLSVTDYLGAGGIAGAVQQSAEAAVAALDQRGRIAAQWLFTQLVLVDAEGAMTRRRISHDDLHHPDPDTDLALDDVIEAFVSARLLTADDLTLQISHEALLTAWPRLREWVLTDLDSARLQQRIADAAQSWRERDHDPGALLRGGTLADAQTLAAQPLTSSRILTTAEMQFVAASSAQASAEAAAAHQRTRRLQALLAVMTVLALLAATLTVVSLRARNDATTARDTANTARDEALSRQLAITADKLREADPALAAQLSLTAYQTSPTIQARSSLLDATAVLTPTRFVGPPGDMHAVASRDGRTLAVSNADGTTRLWRLSQPAARAGEPPQYQPAGELDNGSGPVYASAFSPDGRWLAVSADPGVVTLWEFPTTKTPIKVADLATSGGDTVYSLTFNHDATQLAAGTSQPAVHRWALTPNTQPQQLPTITAGFTGSVHAVSYHPHRAILAAASEDGKLTTWRTPQSGNPKPLGTAANADPNNWVLSLTFSPDGRDLLTGGKSGTVQIWDLTDPTTPKPTKTPFNPLGSWVNSVAYTPDGKHLAAASSDGFTHIYRTSDGSLTAKLPGPGAFTAVQFTTTTFNNPTTATPNPTTAIALLTAEVGGTARLWPLPGPTLTGFSDSIWNVITPTNTPLLAVSPGRRDGRIRLYDTTNPASPKPLNALTIPAQTGHTSGALALSADGVWIASGTTTGKVIIWERNPKTRKVRLAGIEAFSDTLIQEVTISNDGSRLATTAASGKTGVWKLQPGDAPILLHVTHAAGVPQAISFNPDASLLAVGTTSRQVNLWHLPIDGSTPTPLTPLEGFENYVQTLSFDPTGRYLAVGSMDRTTRIFDLVDPTNPTLIGSPIRGPQDAVGSLDWSPRGNLLAAAIVGGTVWLWDVTDPATPTHLATLSTAAGRLFTTTFTPEGTNLYAAGAGRTVSRWDLDTTTIAKTICQHTGTPMTTTEWQRWVPEDVSFTPPCSV